MDNLYFTVEPREDYPSPGKRSLEVGLYCVTFGPHTYVDSFTITGEQIKWLIEETQDDI